MVVSAMKGYKARKRVVSWCYIFRYNGKIRKTRRETHKREHTAPLRLSAVTSILLLWTSESKILLHVITLSFYKMG